MKHLHRRMSAWILGLAVAALAPPAGATLVDTQTTGVVTSRVGGLGDFFMDGETVQIHFTWDDEAMDLELDPDSGFYDGALTSLIVDFQGSGLSFEFATGAPLDDIGTMDDQGTFPLLEDTLILSSSNRISGILGGLDQLSITILFSEIGEAPGLVVDELPPQGPFGFQAGLIGFAAFDGQALVTGGVQFSQVPEPSAAALLLLGLVGLSAVRRR